MSEKVASLDCMDKIASHLEENIPDLNKITPILKQMEENDYKIINNLNSFDSKKVSKLHMATILGACQLVQELIQNGSEVDSQTERKITPLHLAEIVRILLENGANPNKKSDPYFHTSLHMAASEWGNLDAIKLMLHYGADLNSRTITGCSVLHSAIIYKHLEIAKLVLRNGMEVNDKNA